jgi:hypothetical protein
LDNSAVKDNSIFETIKTVLGIIAAFLGIIGPLAYLMGVSYHQGKLEEYGIDYAQFPLSISGAYISAYSFIALIWMKPVNAIHEFFRSIINPPGLWWFLIIASLWIIFVSAIRLLLSKAKKGDSKKIKIDPNSIKKIFKITLWSLLPPYLLFAIPVFFTFLWLVWVSPSYYAYLQGKETARKEINLFEEEGCTLVATSQLSWSKCTSIKDKDRNVVHEGLLLQIQNKKVAIFESSNNDVVIFELPDGYYMSRPVNPRANP